MGRPKGSKNKTTIQKEHRQRVRIITSSNIAVTE